MKNIDLGKVETGVLNVISDFDRLFEGAYNVRVNGQSAGRASTKNVKITKKQDNPGIDVTVAPGTKQGLVHIPVVVSESGIHDEVYNDFYIGEDSDVLIIAGCGLHNDASHLTQHNGIHTFYVGKGAKVKYVERHYGEGEGTGKKVLDPVTIIHLEENSLLEMETVQIEGVDSTLRVTKCDIADGAKLVIKEKLMTSGAQKAVTDYTINLNGENSAANLMSRSVAKGNSYQEFKSVMNGNNKCTAHSECDAIIMDKACVKAIPDVTANHVDAEMIHEAAIGKIAGEQIVKLMTLGISEQEAEQKIVAGFLR